jgi:hypothetical protein
MPHEPRGLARSLDLGGAYELIGGALRSFLGRCLCFAGGDQCENVLMVALANPLRCGI